MDLLSLCEEGLWFACSTFYCKVWDSHCSGLGFDWVLPCLGLEESRAGLSLHTGLDTGLGNNLVFWWS